MSLITPSYNLVQDATWSKQDRLVWATEEGDMREA